MGLILGCIADDYTGASDLANTLTKCGLRTVQTVGLPSGALVLPEIDAVVIALKIRSTASDKAVHAARTAGQWLRHRGVAHTLYKICSTFDSTDKGNIGPVTEALALDVGATLTIITPAFPETGRTVYLGHLFVGSQPLNESPLKDHPLNPMHDANLVRVMARQSRGKIGLLDLHAIAKGTEHARKSLSQLRAAGYTALIADAVFERDLEVIGELALEGKLSTGASGLGLGLARALIRSGQVKKASADFSEAMRPVGGLSVVVAGSCSSATLEQISVAARSMPTHLLDPDRLVNDPAEAEQAISWAAEHMQQGPIVIAASADPETVAKVQSKYGREASGHAIEAATATIVEALIGKGARRIVLAGGETSGAAVDRLNIPAFLIGPEIAPGVPVLRSLGNRQGDLLMALKSGNFGGPDFFAKALATMQ
jgi:3-dehydrotetronate 4-kinase